MRIALFAGMAAALAVCGIHGVGAQPESAAACPPEGDLHFICGMPAVEDLMTVDGGKWIVGSSFKAGPVGLYLIDPVAKAMKPVTLSIGKAEAPYDQCPGAPDLSKVQTHGLDLKKDKDGTSLVFAVNHVARESVEVYRLTPAQNRAVWIGCVVTPEGGNPNSVVSLPDGSMVVTKFVDSADKNGMGNALAGKVTGLIYHWTPGKGWAEVANSALPGDNGLIASPDGKMLYVNAWGSSEVWRLPLSGAGKPLKVLLDFHPDNLRWAPDGSIFATGQIRTDDLPPAQATGWGIARINPQTMAATDLMTYKGTATFGYATSTVQVGHTVFIGTYRGDKVAYRDLP